MRAIAAIGAGMDLRSNPEERVDVHDDAEHNVEIEVAQTPRP